MNGKMNGAVRMKNETKASEQQLHIVLLFVSTLFINNSIRVSTKYIHQNEQLQFLESSAWCTIKSGM